MKGAVVFSFAVLLLHLCAGEYFEIDSVTVSSPGYLQEGETIAVVFDMTFTTYNGTADAIESDPDDTLYMVVTYIADDHGHMMDAEYNATLTSSMIATDLTDETSNTWTSISTTVDLTDIECDNDTYTYFCASIMPSPNATWDMLVDVPENGTCTELICRYEVDVGVTAVDITNPDDELIFGGGQAINVDVTVMIDAFSKDVGGYNVWNINAFLSTSMTGDSKAAESDVTLSFSERSHGLMAGSEYTFESAAVTLDLMSLDCDDDYYFCAEIEPHTNAYWFVHKSGNMTDKMCISFDCSNTASVSTASVLVSILSLLSMKLFS